MPILGIIAASIQKAFSSFSDTFNRTTTGSLGTSSSGGLWASLRGTWFANGSSAQSDDLANTYPISTIVSASENSNLSVVPGSGGKLISTGGTVGSVASGNGTTGVTGFHWATITGMSSTTGINVGDWIYATSGTGSLYGGTPDYVEVTSVVSSSSITYRIKGGTVPVAGTVSNIYTKGKDGGSGVSVWVTDSGNWFGVSYGRSINTSCNCSQCGNGTFSCIGYTATKSQNYSVSTSYSCSGYGYDLFYGVYTFKNFSGYIYGYSQPPQYQYRCSKYTGTNSYTALGTYTFSGYACSTYSENTSTCNCQTCYPPYIAVIKSASNVITEVTRWTLASMAAAFRVVANPTSKILTIRPYKDKAMSTQIGLDLTSDISATAIPTSKFGIVLTPSDQLQGNNVDDFNLGQN